MSLPIYHPGEPVIGPVLGKDIPSEGWLWQSADTPPVEGCWSAGWNDENSPWEDDLYWCREAAS